MQSFANVTVDSKANIYFDGHVISHTLRFADGTRKTLGLIYPGKYHFGTAAPEQMEIISGACEVNLDGSEETLPFPSGESFHIPGNSGFTIQVKDGICEYICSFLPA